MLDIVADIDAFDIVLLGILVLPSAAFDIVFYFVVARVLDTGGVEVLLCGTVG